MGRFPRKAALCAKVLAGFLATAMALFVGACPGIPNDGRYQSHDGGRSNFRAMTPTDSPSDGVNDQSA
jgi:hypothetical protein